MKKENYIKRFRLERGLTYKQAGEIVGVSKQAYHQAEHNWPNVFLETLVKYATAFGYKVNINVVGESQNQEQSCSPTTNPK